MTQGGASRISEGLRGRLNAAGQEHLLQFAGKLPDGDAASLESQLSEMDFEHLNSLFQVATKKHFSGEASNSDSEALEPPQAVQTLDGLDAATLAEFENIGTIFH